MLYESKLQGNLTILTATARVTIAPGTSEMNDDEWDAIADHPTVEGLLDNQTLIIQDTKPKAKPKAESTTPKS
jgi:hypothetical protein